MQRSTAVVRLALVALQLAAVIVLLSGSPDLGHFFSYFTIESNIVSAVTLTVTAALLLRGRDTTSRTLTLWRGLGTFAMVVTGIIYAVLLSGIDVQTGGDWKNVVVHYLMPVVVLVDWLITPRARISLRSAAWWLVFPLLYFVYSMVRGPLVDWYPYPFMDARIHSTGAITVTFLVLAVLMALLVAVLAVLPSPGARAGAPVR